jgi:hypothetical protein
MVVVLDSRVVLVLFLATPMVAVAAAVGARQAVTQLTVVVQQVQLSQVQRYPLLTAAQYTEAHNGTYST